jgi:hypothetical protein
MLDAGDHSLAASYAAQGTFAASANTGSLHINQASQTITWATPAAIPWGAPLGSKQLDAMVSVSGPAPAGTPSYSPGAGTVLGPGSQTLTVTAAATTDYKAASASVSLTVLSQFLYLLDAKASRSLDVTSQASITLPGPVAIASTSSSALYTGDAAKVSAASIQIVGGFTAKGSSSVNPTPTTGIAPFADPLAALSGPSTAGLTYQNAAYDMGNGSYTLQPGIYRYIDVGGNAHVTMQPGLYLIEGGGLLLTGNASLSGSGVTIYNANSNYPNAGGTLGGISLSGNGTVNLSAASTAVKGAYPGIVIFQSRVNNLAMSLTLGSGTSLTGTVYAPSAPVVVTGNGTLAGSMIVDQLWVKGQAALTEMANGSDGPLDSTDGNTLLAGNLEVYVNDPSGYFSTDELARIQDAISSWNALLAPYSVSISETSDPTQANIVLDNGTTSVSGSTADGVLGCYNPAANEITILQGWDWYAGADPTQIGAGQYDFQTVVSHELGHAVGLGGSSDPNSPMNESLPAATTRRTMTLVDLNLTDPPEGADPERTAPRLVEMAQPGSAGSQASVPLVETTRKDSPTRGQQPGWTLTTIPCLARPVTPASAAAPGGLATAAHSGTVSDEGAPASSIGVPSIDESAPEWLDRLFQEEQSVLSRRQEVPELVTRLASLLADSRTPTPCQEQASCLDRAAVQLGKDAAASSWDHGAGPAPTHLEGLLFVLLFSSTFTPSRDDKVRRTSLRSAIL